MANYVWPTTWRPSSFSAWVVPNQRVFTGPYAPVTQVLDLIGDVWTFTMQLRDGTDQVEAAQIDAFLARLKGAENTVEVPMFHRETVADTLGAGISIPLKNGSGVTIPLKNGSGVTIPLISGTPVLAAAIAQGARIATLRTLPGRTIAAGRFFGLVNGQAFMQTVDATADANGEIQLEVTPRARTAMAAYTTVKYSGVTVKYRLKSLAPIVFRKGSYEGPAIEGIEVP
jgi:hypothetical protein